MTVAWMHEPVLKEHLSDLGKFCFTAATTTLAFLAAAEKINTPSEWKGQLMIACGILAFATAVAALMVIMGAPYAKKTPAKPSGWPGWIVGLWFVVWIVGAGIGLAAVIPDPQECVPPNPSSG